MVATTRSVFDHQLNQLTFKTSQLSELVTTQALQAVKALQKRDLTIASYVDTFDANVNKMRYDLEEQCYTLLALQQPNAKDMRHIVATVSIVTNLERMGDHAAGIARLVMRHGHTKTTLNVPEFNEMVEIATGNLAD